MPKKDKNTEREQVGGVAEDDAAMDAQEIKAEFTEHEVGEVPVEDSGRVTRPTTEEAQKEEGSDETEVPLVAVDGDLTPREAYKDPEFNPVAAAEPPGHRGGPGAPDDQGTDRAEVDEDVKERLDSGHDEKAENLEYDWKGTNPGEKDKA